ncbi:hypothetical protein N0V82_000028 [Gnomoniopsis sp. IMI 355080]|nr:hypothetical protein N0V82_000028 [Gnomoniopsis sp. IMI 355080]
MMMQPLPPEPLSTGQGLERITDSKGRSNPKTMSMAEKIKQTLKGKSPVDTPVQAPTTSPGWNPFTNFMAEEQGANDRGRAAISQAVTGPATHFRENVSTAIQPTSGEPSASNIIFTTGQQNALGTEEVAAAGSATTGQGGIDRLGPDTKGKGKAVAGPDTTNTNETCIEVRADSKGEQAKAEVIEGDATEGKHTNLVKRSQRRSRSEDALATERASTGRSAITQEARATQVGTATTAGTEKTDAAATNKSKGMFGGLFKKSQKSKDKDIAKEVQAAASSLAKLTGEATKAAEGLKVGNVPQIKIGEGPMAEEAKEESLKRYHDILASGGSNPFTMLMSVDNFGASVSSEATKTAEGLKTGHVPQIQNGAGHMSEEAKDEALKRYQDILASGGSDPFTMLMSVDNFGALDTITELPPVRAHSISEDTVLIGKSGPQKEHDLSTDNIVSTVQAAPAHALAHDRVINVEPSKRGTHRLSADAMIPIRAAAPGHHLDADPAISGPKQLFPHELLDDTRVLRSKSPQPHGLDLDKTLAASQKQSRAHDLHNDIVLAAPQARTAHDLHSDLIVKLAEPVGREHDLAHDVRILSPSGIVRDPHLIGDDEIIKENAVFRKSPHPDAMIPGDWAASSSSGASDVNNPMASLNASLQTAGQALNELNQAMGVASQEKENTAGM